MSGLLLVKMMRIIPVRSGIIPEVLPDNVYVLTQLTVNIMKSVYTPDYQTSDVSEIAQTL